MLRNWSGKRMKKTQFKDTLKNIRKQKVSYLSVVIIAMLAATIFLGINFASRSIGMNGHVFYEKTCFRDVEIVSTFLLTEDDLNAIRAVEGVAEAEGAVQLDGVLFSSNDPEDVSVTSLTSKVNIPAILEGRLPEGDDECAVETTIAKKLVLKPGDSIKVADKTGDCLKGLKNTEYTVTGVIYYGETASTPEFSQGRRSIVMARDAFDMEAMENCYTKALVTFTNTDGLFRFGKEYLDAVKEVEARIDVLADERAKLRYEEVYGKYKGQIDEGQAKLDDAQQELEDSRQKLDDGWAQSESGRADLDDAKKKLEDAKAEIDKGQKEIEDGQKELDKAKAELEAAKKELDKGGRKLKDAKSELDSAKKELSEGRSELKDGISKIDEAKDEVRTGLYNAIKSVIGDYVDEFDWEKSTAVTDVDDPKASATRFAITKGIVIDLDKSMADNVYGLISSLGLSEEQLRTAFETATGIIRDLADGETWIGRVCKYIVDKYNKYDTDYNKLAQGARDWNSGHRQYIDGKKEYDKGLKEYNDGKAKFDKSLQQYNAGLAKYNKGVAELERAKQKLAEGIAEYEAGLAKYEQGTKDLENGIAELEDGEKKYSDGLDEYNAGADKLKMSREELNKMDQCRWVVLDCNKNVSYNIINGAYTNLKDIAMTFAVVFAIVAALVIFATLGKIIDEQRKQVGTTKALGFFNREIFFKYLFFGVSGTFIGTVLGCVLAYFAVQSVVIGGYSSQYVFGYGDKYYDALLIAIVIVSGILLSTVTVWSACYSLLRSTALRLMQDKIPAARRRDRKNGNKRSKGGLYGRLIIRNMITDKKRVVATIVSVAGCCTLLVAGFSVQFSVDNAIDGQFTKFEHYDQCIKYDSDVSDTVSEDMRRVFDENNVSCFEFADIIQTVSSGDALFTMELEVGDLDKIGDYFSIRSAATGEKADLSAEGIWVHKMVSERYNVKAGDELTLYNATMKPFKARVAGVFDNYIGWFAFMNTEYYRNLFGDDARSPNAFFINLNGADPATVDEQIRNVDGFIQLKDISEIRESYTRMASVLNSVSLVCIVMSALMAYFILLNLVSMFINQKKRELTIMRVNGFRLREVIMYVARELIAATLIGIILGMGCGTLLGSRVIHLVESAQLQFDRSIQFTGWLYSAIITFIFAAAVCIPVFRRIKYLKLSDVN